MIRITTATLLAAALVPAIAQANSHNQDHPDIAAARQLDERFFAALGRLDVDGVMANYSRSAEVASVSPDGKKSKGQVEIRAGYTAWFATLQALEVVRYDNRYHRMADGSMVVWGEAIAKLTPKGGTAQRTRFVYTDVRRKEGGKWVTLFDQVTASPAPDSLYARLGGFDAIAAVVDDFIPRLVADPQLKPFFVGLSADSGAKLRQHLVEQVCAATGGPCLYTGRDMKTAHAGLAITGKQWDASVKALVASLDQFNVQGKTRDELLGAVSALKPQIVEKP